MLMAQKILKSIWEKELSFQAFILSHLLILAFGLGVLGWLYYMLYDIKLPFAPKSAFESYQPVTTTPISFNLDLNNPDEDSLVFDKSIVISGKTSPQASVIVSVDDKDTALQSNSNGDFSKVVVLSSGLNRVRVDAFDSQGNTKEVTRLVYFSEEKLDE